MSHQTSSSASSGPGAAPCLSSDPPAVPVPFVEVSTEVPTEEALSLRACVRDLVALTTLPAVWTGRSARVIGGDLADALLGILRADSVLLRLEASPEDAPVEIVRTAPPSPGADPLRDVGPETIGTLGRDDGDAVRTVPNPAGPGTWRVLSTPIGHDGALGRLAVASRRPGFPTATERLLLSTGANQAAIALAGARTAAALARQERALSDFVENGTEAMHWVGPDGSILWANRAEMDLLGYGPDEYLGRHIAEFHADPDVIEDILARLTRGEKLHDYPARLRCRDGSVKHVLIHSSVLWEEGRFVHTRCFTRDVTAQKLAERRLALQYAVAQALADAETLEEAGAPILGAIGETLGWAAGLLWAVDSEADVLRCVDVWHAPAAPLAKLMTAVSRDRTFPPGVGLPGRIWASGEATWIPDVQADDTLPRAPDAARAGVRSAFGFPVRVGDEVLGVLELFSRETSAPDDDLRALMVATGSQIGQFIRRRRAEAERARALTAAQEALRARDEFLSAAAHDLKTPLTGIKGGAQLLRRLAAKPDGLDAERLYVALAGLDIAATRVTRQVDQLLDATRLQAGQPLALQPRPTDLVVLSRQAVAEHQQAAETHRLRLETDEPELTGRWDRGRLERLVDNLLANAIKYSPDGGEVVLTLRRERTGAREWAALTVADQGIGIPAPDLERIFDRFARASNVPAWIGGSGIGLASVRQIVEQHGGAIEVASRAGQGSAFTVRLPLSPEAAAASPIPAGGTPG